MAKTDQPVELNLERFKPLDAELVQAAADYGPLKIAGLDDRAGYDSVVKAISRLTGLRTSIENARVEIKKPALDFGRKVDAEAKRLTNLVAGAEAKLREERNRIDGERQKQIQAEARAAVEKFKARTDALFAVGFVFDGVDYIAGSLHILAEGLNSLTDEKFDECIELGKEEVRIEKARKAAEVQREEVVAQKADAPVETTTGDVVGSGAGIFDDDDTFSQARRKISDLPPSNGPTFGDPSLQNLFNAGFDACREKVLQILNSPDKFTREQLRESIRALQS